MAQTKSAMTAQTYLPLIISPFVAWRIYLRAKCNIGRQPLQTGRTVWRIFIFAAISAGYGVLTAHYPRVLFGLCGGLTTGALLAQFAGLPLTSFEATTEGRFYKPHSGIGISLSLVLVGRIVYRAYMLHSGAADFLQNYPGRFQSPLTSFLLGLTTGYYLAYYIGVLLRGRELGKAA
jgi:hypothetical protein